MAAALATLLAAAQALSLQPISPLVARTALPRMAVSGGDGPGLDAVTDDSFDADVLQCSRPVLIDFYGEYCGQCKRAEPALERFDMDVPSVKVVKVRLNHNPAIEDWLGKNEIQVRKLPTLLLVKRGMPQRTMIGADKILDAESLHRFALDDAVGGVVLPTSQLSYEEALESMSEREQTRELQVLVDSLRASSSTAPEELQALEAELARRQQRAGAESDACSRE